MTDRLGQLFDHSAYRQHAKVRTRIAGLFYCDFREDQKKDLRGLLSSLLVPLCHQSDSYFDILSSMARVCGILAMTPSSNV